MAAASCGLEADDLAQMRGLSNAPALHTTQVELYWLANGSQT